MDKTPAEIWIQESCKASQNKFELTDLYHELLKIDPKLIVEIGCHFGGSLEAWTKLFPTAKVIGIEKQDQITIEDPGFEIVTGDSHEHLTLRYLEIIIKDQPIDFLFIDGDHLYDSVKKDFEMYSPLVKKGGMVVFHDAFLRDNDTVEVYKFWKEISPKYGHRLIHDPEGGTGTGILFL